MYFLAGYKNPVFFWPLLKELFMTNSGVRRKLSAILSADVKGYSRLMAEDEAGTVETLKEYREVMASFPICRGA